MTLRSRLRLEWALLCRKLAHWWSGDHPDKTATLKAEIDLALSLRKRGREQRQEAARKGAATKRLSSASRRSVWVS